MHPDGTPRYTPTLQSTSAAMGPAMGGRSVAMDPEMQAAQALSLGVGSRAGSGPQQSQQMGGGVNSGLGGSYGDASLMDMNSYILTLSRERERQLMIARQAMGFPGEGDGGGAYGGALDPAMLRLGAAGAQRNFPSQAKVSMNSQLQQQQQLEDEQLRLMQHQQDLQMLRGGGEGTFGGGSESLQKAPQAETSGTNGGGGTGGSGGSEAPTKWWVCKHCKTRAFASRDEASEHEAVCVLEQRVARGSQIKMEAGSLARGMQQPLRTASENQAKPPFWNEAAGLRGQLGQGDQAASAFFSPAVGGLVGMNPHDMQLAGQRFASRRKELDGGLVGSLDGGASAALASAIDLGVSDRFAVLDQPLPLAMSSDKDWLTPLHCFVRRHCVEVFTATAVDVATPSKGKRRPIQVGQVGIRCPHCHNKDDASVEGRQTMQQQVRERGSVYYPARIESIYNATMNLLQRHLSSCAAVPPEIMSRYKELKGDDARSGTSKRYWIDSARSLGLIDTVQGIRYSGQRPPPLPSRTMSQIDTEMHGHGRRNSNDYFAGQRPQDVSSKDEEGSTSLHEASNDGEKSVKSDDPEDAMAVQAVPEDAVDDEQVKDEDGQEDEDEQNDGSVEARADGEGSSNSSTQLVFPEDEPTATAFSFHLLMQMQPCVFTEADRLGKRKGLPEGFAGLACKHCYGGYGSGRFFPSSIKTLSDTSKTLNVLHNHMMRCRKCPESVREKLKVLRKNHDEERAKMKFGSQKAFFAKIWGRLREKERTNVGGRASLTATASITTSANIPSAGVPDAMQLSRRRKSPGLLDAYGSDVPLPLAANPFGPSLAAAWTGQNLDPSGASELPPNFLQVKRMRAA